MSFSSAFQLLLLLLFCQVYTSAVILTVVILGCVGLFKVKFQSSF